MKIQEIKGRKFIGIPKVLADQKGWVKGQELLLIFNERGNIEITDSQGVPK